MNPVDAGSFVFKAWRRVLLFHKIVLRLAPGNVVALRVVQNFPETVGRVSMILEVLD